MFLLVKSYQGRGHLLPEAAAEKWPQNGVRRTRPVSKPRLVIKVRVVSPGEMNAE